MIGCKTKKKNSSAVLLWPDSEQVYQIRGKHNKKIVLLFSILASLWQVPIIFGFGSTFIEVSGFQF